MSYRPILAPEEFHEWLQKRARRLTKERGSRVSMAATLRELPAVIEVIEANEDVQAAAKRAVAKTVQA